MPLPLPPGSECEAEASNLMFCFVTGLAGAKATAATGSLALRTGVPVTAVAVSPSFVVTSSEIDPVSELILQLAVLPTASWSLPPSAQSHFQATTLPPGALDFAALSLNVVPGLPLFGSTVNAAVGWACTV